MSDSAAAAALLDPSPRVRRLRQAWAAADGALRPVVDIARPYVTGLDNLPADGRFLLVGNHTAASFAEVFLIPHYVRRAIGGEVRMLADRAFGMHRGPAADLIAAYGGVVGSPESVRELMDHDETILVFPGGGQEIAKFKGEEYVLRWKQREGFAREAVARDYPIVPVGLVGGDDVYQSLTTRDSMWGRLIQAAHRALPGGPPDMAMPLVRGVGPTLIPRPQRMYLAFGEPISTTRPARTAVAKWVTSVRNETKASLERLLDDLLTVRGDDPYRELNPLAWHRAVQPQDG
ncbi:lysophospholipid acyltransferase family protein [Mycobacterium sp. ACS4331]|uniref:lysophospholipid acyltransferase family protein n=1 Tax=Mycobacterium sp. ACS4331 TaxID=1834121 RepID=UPI0008005E31|nr:lysophospholipid acyltransferase family protein [Mycobacterium sp. ACS4331]OBF27469.1 glycerol acyltransferase [Mycobacterium sp. ACS4331]